MDEFSNSIPIVSIRKYDKILALDLYGGLQSLPISIYRSYFT